MPRNDRSGAFLRLLTAAFVKSGIAGVKVSAVQLILDMTKGLAEAYKLDKNFSSDSPFDFNGITGGVDNSDELIHGLSLVIEA